MPCSASTTPRVDLLVPCKVGSLAEGFGAGGAGVGFLSCVGSLVGDKEKVGMKALLAVGASVKPVLGMEPLVLQESRDDTEAFPTAGTLIGSHLGVDPLVPPQCGAISVALPAVGTLEGSLPGVDPLVFP